MFYEISNYSKSISYFYIIDLVSEENEDLINNLGDLVLYVCMYLSKEAQILLSWVSRNKALFTFQNI